jgi:cardiolipin synthase A/B
MLKNIAIFLTCLIFTQTSFSRYDPMDDIFDEFEETQELPSFTTVSLKKRPDIVFSQEKLEASWANAQEGLLNPNFIQKMDVLTDSQTTFKNQAQILMGGMMSYPVRYKLIDNAKRSILISALSFDSGRVEVYEEVLDQTVLKLITKLEKAIERGVVVHLIMDGAVSFVKRNDSLIRKLRKMGVKLIKYNPLISQNYDRHASGIISYARALRRNFKKKRRKQIQNRWHDKTIVVDGTYAIKGGLNWGESYGLGNQFIASDYPVSNFLNSSLIKEINLTKEDFPNSWGELKDFGWRDNDILLKGPIVKALTKTWLKNFTMLEEIQKSELKWYNINQEFSERVLKTYSEKYKNNETYFPKDNFSQTLNSSPFVSQLMMRPVMQLPKLEKSLPKYKEIIKKANQWDLYINKKNPSAHISHLIVNLINCAKNQILWGAFSLDPTEEVLNALTRASKRGVNIFLITNSKKTSKFLDDKGRFTYKKSSKNYYDLISAGMRIFEWQPSVVKNGKKLLTGAFHSKNLSIDGVMTFMGSFNISNASFNNHTEGGVLINSSELTSINQKMFHNDLSYTREVIFPNDVL